MEGAGLHAALDPQGSQAHAQLTGRLPGEGEGQDVTGVGLAGSHAGGEAAEVLETALTAEVGGLGLTVAVRPIAELADEGADTGSSWALSLYGADKPGIVHRVTKLLADHGANIVDLSTRVVGPGPEHAYVLLLELDLPPDADVERLRNELATPAAEMGVEAHLRPDDAEIL